MTIHEFINRIRSLYNIDHYQLPELTDEQWLEFRDNPPRYLMHTDKQQAKAIIREVEKRQTRHDVGEDSLWQPISSAPRNEWIEVCGDSGMNSPQHFITLAIHDANYRPLEPWRNVQLDALRDFGWIPLFWRRASSVPQVR
jgi:hypothetical protein